MDSDIPLSPGEDVKIKIEPDLEVEPVKVTKKKKRKPPSEKQKAKDAERQRKARANLSEEQRRLDNEKILWRKRIREGHPSITEEKLKELKEKYGIDTDKLREKYTPERREEIRRINLEKKREHAKKVRQNEEKRKEIRARERFRLMEKRLLMTEEEKEQQRVVRYLRMQVYYAKHGRYYERSREDKDKQNAKFKKWRDNLTGEKKKRFYESVYRTQKKRLARLKEEDPNFKHTTYCTAYWNKVKGEDSERWRKYREKENERQRNRYQAETDDERKKRRYKDKVNGVKRKLRKQLEQEGVEASEIEKRVNEVHERMWKEFDPEWSWEKYGQKATAQVKVDPPVNAGDKSAATSANIQAACSTGRLDVNVNQKEKLQEALQISLPGGGWNSWISNQAGIVRPCQEKAQTTKFLAL